MNNSINKKRLQVQKQKFHPKKKKTKLIIKFDEKARREFLAGFRKRKLERKKRAKENLEMQIKAERQRIKSRAKAQLKNILLQQASTPEFENLHSEKIDMGSHFVNITELSSADLAEKNNWIGINRGHYQRRDIEIKNNNSTKNNCLVHMKSPNQKNKVIKKGNK